jgi:hypothetical protein
VELLLVMVMHAVVRLQGLVMMVLLRQQLWL